MNFQIRQRPHPIPGRKPTFIAIRGGAELGRYRQSDDGGIWRAYLSNGANRTECPDTFATSALALAAILDAHKPEEEE